MKTGPATFIAITVGWALPLGGMILIQLARTGRTSDLVVSAFWTGLFAFIAWAIVVLPLMLRFKHKKIFADPRVSWLGWGILATVIYAVTLPAIFGRDMFIIIWYPALMGCISGAVFAFLVSKSRTH